MPTINLFDAKTHLSRLVDQIASGEETEIIVARSGKPVARLVPVSPRDTSRRIGIAKGEFTVPDDIDAHNDEVANLLTGCSAPDAPAA